MSAKKQHTNSADLQEVLDDLCMRFLVNLPSEEYESFERLFFAIEAAHWFYDDFYRERDPSLPRLPLKQFAAKLFDRTALLQQYRNQVEKLTAAFQSYKQVVMTCGAALLNPSMDKVVLVRGWGHTARWGFPKGKLAKDETELAAAIREVMEEIGFDMSPCITEDQFYIDSFTSGRHSRIFLVPGIPEDTIFETMTRKEISDIRWVPISVLPDSLKSVKNQNKAAMGKSEKGSPSSDKSLLFAQNGVTPFTKRLRGWIKRQKKRTGNRHQLSQTETDLLAIVEVQEAPLQPSFSETENGTHALDTSQMMSVDELEASMKTTSKEVASSNRRRTGKAKGRGTGDVMNKGNGKKSKKESDNSEARRNQATFGTDGGTTMSVSERERLFRRYVVETDKIAAARGLQEEFWPVPYVTSKDFSAQEVKDAEDEHHLIQPPLGIKENGFATASPSRADECEHAGGRDGGIIMDLPRPTDKPFVFDRRAIMACLTMGNPS